MTNGNFTERQRDPGRTGSFPLRLPAGQSEPIRGQGHFFSRRRARIRPRAVLARRKQASCNQTFAGGNPPRRNGKVLPTRAEGGATYKRGKTPVSSEDIDVLNQMLSGLGYKI